MKILIPFGLVLLLSVGLVSPQMTLGQQASTDAKTFDINTPILTLLTNEVARVVVEKHLPNLVKALDEDFDIAEYLGYSSLKELSIDDNHVKGFDEEMLGKIQRDLEVALGS